MLSYSSTNFRILKFWTIISNLIRFDLGFWKRSQPFYRKLKYRDKVCHFPWKMVLYSSCNFPNLRPSDIISNFIRLDLGFWQASKPFYRKLKYTEKVFEEFECLPDFPRKMVLCSSTNFCILKPWAIISKLMRFDLGFCEASKPFYRKVKCREKVLK